MGIIVTTQTHGHGWARPAQVQQCVYIPIKSTYLCVLVCMYVFTCGYRCTCTCMCVCTCMQACVSLYVHKHMHMYMYVHLQYVHTTYVTLYLTV